MIARLFIALSLLPLLVRALFGCSRDEMRMRILGLTDHTKLPAAEYVEENDELVLHQNVYALNEARKSEYERLVKAAENHRAVGKYKAPAPNMKPKEKPLGKCALCYTKCADTERYCDVCMLAARTQKPYRPKGTA
jgi:hypothetical protein